MIGYSRGDIVLVEFNTTPYHQARREVIIAAITSNVTRQLFGDHAIQDWQGAGLLFPSVLTGILRTIRQFMIRRQLGTSADDDLQAFEDVLRQALGI